MMNAGQITFAGQFRNQIVEIFGDVSGEKGFKGLAGGSIGMMKLRFTFYQRSKAPARMPDDFSQ